MAKRQVFHSSNTKEGWVVTSEGKVVGGFNTQAEAEAEAMRLAKKAEADGGLGQAVLHKADGEIKEERTYGKDPRQHSG
jgi:hypothetical protein